MDELPYLPKEEQDIILNSPALEAPDGINQLENPPNNNALAHGVLAACVAVSTICLILRVYVQAFLARKFRPEDILTCCGFGTFIGWIYCSYMLMEYPGYFVHQWDITLQTLVTATYYIHLAGVFYSVTLPALKVAILLEWTRMFVPRGTRNAFWWMCHVVMGVQILFMIGAVLALCLVCQPYEKTWDVTVKGTCGSKPDIDLAASIVHLVCDICILLLPQKVIWGLKLSLKKKLGVSLIFGLGLLACVSAAFRVAVTVAYTSTLDVSYMFGPVIFWATAEMVCGFVVVCVPSAPRVLTETGMIRKAKRLMGMSATATGKSATNMSGSHMNHSKSGTTSNTYRKIDEDGVPLENMGAGKWDSTERLHDGSAKFEKAITRTTQVTVTDDHVDNVRDDLERRGQGRWEVQAARRPYGGY